MIPRRGGPYNIVAAVNWAIAFVVGMVAIPPPHHTWAWLCLAPFCWHVWWTLMFINTLIRNGGFHDE